MRWRTRKMRIALIVVMSLILWRSWGNNTSPHAGARTPAKVVIAQEFRLVDPGGKTRARLSLLPDRSPGLALMDINGKARVLIRLAPDGTPSLLFNDKDGKTLWDVRQPQEKGSGE